MVQLTKNEIQLEMFFLLLIIYGSKFKEQYMVYRVFYCEIYKVL